ncbi:hypothetical protein MGH68_05600 [Erysipelothrix sp. D19-032]
MMTIKPLIRDNIALNAHPKGVSKTLKIKLKKFKIFQISQKNHSTS